MLSYSALSHPSLMVFVSSFQSYAPPQVAELDADVRGQLAASIQSQAVYLQVFGAGDAGPALEPTREQGEPPLAPGAGGGGLVLLVSGCVLRLVLALCAACIHHEQNSCSKQRVRYLRSTAMCARH